MINMALSDAEWFQNPRRIFGQRQLLEMSGRRSSGNVHPVVLLLKFSDSVTASSAFRRKSPTTGVDRRI